jgi:predicted SprT family Zn-dependent metalloprotease
MVDNTQAPDLGSGPYGVERGEDDFYHITRDGARTGKSYPIGKTAYRTARKLNDAFPLEQAVTTLGPDPDKAPAGFLEDEPAKPEKPAKAPKSPKAPKVKAAKPKAPKASPKPADEPKPAPAVLTFSAETFKGTREQWLNAFTDKARAVFKQRGLELPEKIRVSVGFMFRSPKAIGQCWAESASADGHREVFINPTQADSARVADILTHELAHCLFGPEEKHGKNFKAAVTKLGLEGKATATVAGDAWREWAFPILAKLGPIPHGAIDPSASGVKKQTTRLLKCECDECGFIFRATAKHVNGKALRCPDLECEGIVKVDGGDEEGE